VSYPLRYAAGTWYKVCVWYTDEQAQTHRRILVDTYSNTANAVFGVLRKLESDRSWTPPREAIIHTYAVLLPPCPRGVSKAAYTRHLREQHRLIHDT
jgi:hypothetical protein